MERILRFLSWSAAEDTTAQRLATSRSITERVLKFLFLSTTRRHLDLLTDAFMIRQLQPFHANLRKRQVKSPKIYVRDSGLLHQLLGVDSLKALLTHPKIGASWEGFVIEQVLRSVPHDEAFFWATHQGAEIDLVLRRGDELLGVECKRTDTPRLTRSIGIALEDLGLERVAVVYPGVKRLPLSGQVEAVPLAVMGGRGPASVHGSWL